MADEHRDRGAARWRARPGALRLGALLGVALALALFLTLHGSLQDHSRSATASSCNGWLGTPEVRDVRSREQGSLREDVARVVPQRVARLYEEGSVLARSAWTDEEPAGPPVSAAASRPGGYEMRWWAPNGDDVVADAYQFGDAARARRFVAMASSPRCRRDASRAAPEMPPHATNLTWLNPDGAAQADVFIVRGSRVYRVADAPAGQHGGRTRPGTLRHAFLTIDALACLLPGERCSGTAPNAVPA